MPRYVCPKCQNKVQDKGKENGIACEVCRKWYHFPCSDLTKQQFAILCKIKDLEWICPKCTDDECAKCEKILRFDKRISCTNCRKMYHIRCSGLNIKACEKLELDKWICVKCNEDIFPFSTLAPKNIETLAYNSLCFSKHPNKLKNLKFLTEKKECTRPTFKEKCKRTLQ